MISKIWIDADSCPSLIRDYKKYAEYYEKMYKNR